MSSRRERRNDEGKPPSNPRGWPDRTSAADLEGRRHREISLNDDQDHWFCSNFVRTSKVRQLSITPQRAMFIGTTPQCRQDLMRRNQQLLP